MRPQIIYSDNAKTFLAAEKWINKLNKDEHFKYYHTREEIRWKFNLAKAPWWGWAIRNNNRINKTNAIQIIGYRSPDNQ